MGFCCTKTTQRCPGIHPCCHEHLLETLDFMHTLLTENRITHWLNFGTLLGAVRDQDIIPWDEDVDVGIWEEDVSRVLKLEKRILSGGYCVKVNRMPNTQRVCSIAIFYSHVNSLHLCLNTWTTQDDEACGIEWSGMRLPLDSFREMTTAVLHGKEYPVPGNPEIGLANFYGTDWRTPKVKKWMTQLGTSPKCVEPNLRELFQTLPEYEYEPGRERGPV